MRRNFKFCFFMMLIIIALFVIPLPASAQESDPWAPFNFLIGHWSGIGSGKPGEAVPGSSVFSFELDKSIIMRKNRVQSEPVPGQTTGRVHEDLLFIYRQTGEENFRAIYFDNEKHVINYTVTFPDKQPSVVFENVATGQSTRFKLAYELTADGILTTDFLIAPPGGEFKSYIKGTAKRIE